jgi:hypothetical protein
MLGIKDMTPQEFIEALKSVVHDSSARAVIDSLESPSGRNPPPKIRQLSEWFCSLSKEDQNNLYQVILLAVHSTLFGTLCVLDGVRAIEDSNDKGAFKLYFEKHGQKILLNDPAIETLHDRYQTSTWDEVFD